MSIADTTTDYSAVPAEIIARDRWGVWRYEERDGKKTKIPYNAKSGRKALPNKTATWSAFKIAQLRAETQPERYAGIGYLFAKGDGYVGVDLDNCIDEQGNVAPWAQEIVDRCATYTEVSPSGRGLKLWCKGTLPTEMSGTRNAELGIEIYQSHRYFTVTGQQLPGTPNEIRDCTEVLAELWHRVKPAPKSNGKSATHRAAPTDSLDASDSTIIEKASSAKNGSKFTRLWSGGWDGEYGSQSEADLALCMSLAFWCGPEAGRIDQLFRQSGLMREKWDRPDGGGTYGSRTITSALERVTEFYDWNRSRGGQSGFDDSVKSRSERPTIIIGTDEPRVNDEAVAALAGDSSVYVRGNSLVHIVRDASKQQNIVRPPNAPRIVAMELPLLREKLAGCARIIKLKETDDGTEEVPQHPPDWMVRGVAARRMWPGLRHLEAVVEEPVLLADGTILDRPGYHAESGIVLIPSTRFPSIPSQPTIDAARAAVCELLEVVADFPFASEAHQSGWLAGVLTLCGRFAFSGPAPMFFIEANQPGSGKSMSADAAARITLGRAFSRVSNPDEDAEMSKLITSIALEAERGVLIDNVGNKLGTPSLDAALTGTTWKARLLGANKTTNDVPLSTVWWATANNAVLNSDIMRRLVHIRLESSLERPEERTDFRHKDLLAWVANERPRLLCAALTILRAYVVAGRPPQGLPAWGSFEGWSDLVRNALVWCGEMDPAEAREQLIEHGDRQGNGLRLLLEGWDEIDPHGYGMTVAEVLEALEIDDDQHRGNPNIYPLRYESLRAAIAELCGTKLGELPKPRSLGMVLHHMRGKVAGGRAIQSRMLSSRMKSWSVSKIG